MTRRLRLLVLAVLISLHAVLLGAAAGISPAVATTGSASQQVTGPVDAPGRSPTANGFRDGCGPLSALCDPIEDAVDGVKDCAADVKDCAGKVKDEVEEAGGKVKDAVEGAGEKLEECRKNGLKNCAKDASGAIVSGTKDAGEAACNSLLSLVCGPIQSGVGAATDCIDDPSECLSGAVSNLTSTIEGLGEVLETIGNPLAKLGSAIAEAVHNILVTLFLAVWHSGLWVLKLVLTLGEMFLTPDLTGDGPGVKVYGVAMWLGLSLLFILALLQLGLAAFKREGKQLGRVFIGLGQFAVIYFGWFLYCALMLIAAGGITKYLMDELLGVKTWADWDLFDEWYNPVKGDIELMIAIVLALLGLLLWLAAIGHLLVYLGRAACLVVLAASGPISAAGLVFESTKSWFWKTLRWFHAAAFTPPLMVFVLGIGVQFATGAAAGLADSTGAVIGTALPAVMIILVSTFAPLALFKLFAFADPGTPSGAAFRQGLALQNPSGLLGGGGGNQASKADSSGKSAGESSADGTTEGRFNKSVQGLVGKFGGPVGGMAAQGLDTFQKLGAQATALTTDVSNQAGVGQHTYGPDFGNNPQQGGTRNGGGEPGDGGPPPDQTSPQSDDTQPPPPPMKPPAPPAPPTPAPQGQSSKPPGGGKPPSGGGGGGGTPPPEVPPVA